MSQFGVNEADGTGDISNTNVERGKGIEEIGKVSVMLRCTDCQKENFSRVESKLSSNGMV